MNEIIHILVADDFEPWRRAVASLLLQKAGWQVVCEVSDGLEAVQKAQELKPDLILLDIGLPKLAGIEAARRIRAVAPDSRILFVSTHADSDFVDAALSTGANGYLVKVDAGSELVLAVEAIFQGKRFVSSQVKGFVLADAEGTGANLDAVPHLREFETLVVRQGNLEAVLTEVVRAAISISGSDFGNLQLLDSNSSRLRIVAQQGFPQWWIDFWDSAPGSRGCSGAAWERCERVIVEDVEQSPIFVGKVLEMQLKAGVRAVQSTPIVSRTGKQLGVISTHYRKPHRPDERTLGLLDLLSREVAEVIESARGKA